MAILSVGKMVAETFSLSVTPLNPLTAYPCYTSRRARDTSSPFCALLSHVRASWKGRLSSEKKRVVARRARGTARQGAAFSCTLVSHTLSPPSAHSHSQNASYNRQHSTSKSQSHPCRPRTNPAQPLGTTQLSPLTRREKRRADHRGL